VSTAEESANSGSLVAQALLTVGIGVAVLVLARLAMLIAMRQFTVSVHGVVAVLLDWGVLIWVVLVVSITVVRAGSSPHRRAALYVAAAAIGAGVSLAVLAVPAIDAMGPEAMGWFLPQQIVRAGAVLVGGTIGGFAAIAIAGSPARPIRVRILAAGCVVSLVIAAALIVSLFWQYLDTYTMLSGSVLTPTPSDRSRYLVTAPPAIIVPVLAIILGRVVRVRSLFVLGIALAIAGLIAAIVLRVP
jgi:hypothetical protein